MPRHARTAMRRTLTLFVVATLLPTVILGAGLGTMALRDQRRAIERQAADQARFAATLIQRELLADTRRVQMIAQSPAFDGALDKARFDTLARRLVADEPLWRTLSVATPEGQRLVDVPRPIGGRQGGRVVDLESLQRTVASRRPAVGRVVAGPKGGHAFAVRAPVLRNGQVVYVVSAVVDPAAVGDLLNAGAIPPGWGVEVVDDAGRTAAKAGVATTAAGEMAEPAVLAARRRGRAGFYHLGSGPGARVAAWRAVPGSGWCVHVTLPASAYNAPLVQAAWLVAVGGFVSLALSGLLAWLLMRELRLNRVQEEAALEGQRLEALGRMTGGVAHDINNLLTPIVGGMDILHRRLADDPRSLRLVDAALASAERAKILVSRLLAFARRQTLEPRDVDVGLLLRGVRDLIERSVGPAVAVRIERIGDLPAARVDPTQLEVALLNLAVNARDAMPGGGVLTLSAEARIGDPQTVGLPAGRYVRIAVSDTGPGMDLATLQRAVEPFFTTKDPGKGTGLGLSMVHGLAAQSGGRLILDSPPGQGVTAEIWLPASHGKPAPQEPDEPLAPGRPARLLLTDDDDLVRASTAELLREHGHTVIEARSTDEALLKLSSGASVEALVTDYAMPGRSGGELIEAARRINPGLPALLITGYAGAADDVPADVVRLGKPFGRVELLNRVAALLPPAA